MYFFLKVIFFKTKKKYWWFRYESISFSRYYNICLPAGISWKAHGCSIVPKELVAQQYKYPKSLSSSGWYRSTECVSFPEKASLATCKLSTTSQLIKLISPHQHKISYFLIFLSREGDSNNKGSAVKSKNPYSNVTCLMKKKSFQFQRPKRDHIK